MMIDIQGKERGRIAVAVVPADNREIVDCLTKSIHPHDPDRFITDIE